ncbi:MAG: glutamine--tRNA ligase/YqeY domain fusion protein [Clostridia bacterium]|nr:glutamine--tRNA ligase/YqeY domain fusion protein [Clostridia bacterium]
MTIEASNFIEDIIVNDLETGKHNLIYTRFPPEPNGYLHVGHSKSLCINFGIKEKFSGKCNLRFDDTNPTKEDVEYVESIKEDIKWLGFEWDKELYASDYFEQTYDLAVKLIEKGVAYVCDYDAEQIRATRGTLTEPGQESPYRNRSIEENLKLFREMREGKYADGSKVLRAKIDMASPNINMRDPVIYRILRYHHHRTGDKWCVYPMYDFAHPIGDALDGVTHSICTLEFEDHRPLYDWVCEQCEFVNPPRQIEFARLNIKNTIMSKRYLKRLVENGHVEGWNDPRMPTLSGMRERGYPAEAVKEFCARVGVAKANSEVDPALLEFCVRENLNQNAQRAMVVERPLEVVIDNMGDDEELSFAVVNNPNNPDSGTHNVILTKNIYIEETDFALNPPPKYKRLVEGGLIRLKGAYILRHVSTELDAEGKPVRLHCEYIEDSASGGANCNIKVKGTVQWASQKYAVDCNLYKYESLLVDATDEVTDFNDRLNPNSLELVEGAKGEPFLFEGKVGESYQFMRQAYYKYAGKKNGIESFYRIVSLKDSFNK